MSLGGEGFYEAFTDDENYVNPVYITRFVKQVEAGPSAVVVTASMAEQNAIDIQQSAWQETDITEATMPPLNFTTNPLSLAYDAFKYASDYASGKQKAYLGAVAYRFKTPDDAQTGDPIATYVSMDLPVYVDRWLIGGVRISVCSSASELPTDDWNEVREGDVYESAVLPAVSPRADQETTLNLDLSGVALRSYIYVYITLEDMSSVSPLDVRRLEGGALILGSGVSFEYDRAVLADDPPYESPLLPLIATNAYVNGSGNTVEHYASLAKTDELVVSDTEPDYQKKRWSGLLRNWVANTPSITSDYDSGTTDRPLSFLINYQGANTDDIIIHVFDNMWYNDEVAVITIPEPSPREYPFIITPTDGVGGVTITGTLPHGNAWFFVFKDFNEDGYYDQQSPQGVAPGGEAVNLGAENPPIRIDLYETNYNGSQYTGSSAAINGHQSSCTGIVAGWIPVWEWEDTDYPHGVGAEYKWRYQHELKNPNFPNVTDAWNDLWWRGSEISGDPSTDVKIRNRNYHHMGDILSLLAKYANMGNGIWPLFMRTHASKDFWDDEIWSGVSRAWIWRISDGATMAGGNESNHALPCSATNCIRFLHRTNLITPNGLAIQSETGTGKYVVLNAEDATVDVDMIKIQYYIADEDFVLHYQGSKDYLSPPVDGDGEIHIQTEALQEGVHAFYIRSESLCSYDCSVMPRSPYVDFDNWVPVDWTLAYEDDHPTPPTPPENGAGFYVNVSGVAYTLGLTDCVLFSQAHIPRMISSVSFESAIPGYQNWMKIRLSIYLVPLSSLRDNDFKYDTLVLDEDSGYLSNDVWLGQATTLPFILDVPETPESLGVSPLLVVDLDPEGYAARHSFSIDPVEVSDSFALYGVISPVELKENCYVTEYTNNTFYGLPDWTPKVAYLE